MLVEKLKAATTPLAPEGVRYLSLEVVLNITRSFFKQARALEFEVKCQYSLSATSFITGLFIFVLILVHRFHRAIQRMGGATEQS
jgi:hypothetical protein